MGYSDPLPDFQRVALAGTLQLAGEPCTLQITPIQQFPDYGPDFDVVHLQVLRDGQPLALLDLSPTLEPALCYQLWGELCAALHEATSAVYALVPGGDPEAAALVQVLRRWEDAAAAG